MVEKRNCSFCGQEIEPGTGSLYIRKDAVSFSFCSKKCRKNQIALGRIPRRTRWTKAFTDMKAAGLSKEARAKPVEGEEPEGTPAPKPVPKKAEPKSAQPAKAAAKAEAPKRAAPQPAKAEAAKPAATPKTEAKAPAAKPAEGQPKPAKAPAKKPKAE
jgi:large subunit ribosomal protein L24e